jgi:hypothetical protein
MVFRSAHSALLVLARVIHVRSLPRAQLACSLKTQPLWELPASELTNGGAYRIAKRLRFKETLCPSSSVRFPLSVSFSLALHRASISAHSRSVRALGAAWARGQSCALSRTDSRCYSRSTRHIISHFFMSLAQLQRCAVMKIAPAGINQLPCAIIKIPPLQLSTC